MNLSRRIPKREMKGQRVMKINLENKDKWSSKEQKKIKRRAITITVFLTLIAVSAATIFIVNYVRRTKGLFYPNVVLEDSVTGNQPQIIPADGYEMVVKAPTLPYTMLVKGETVTDSDAFCIFLTDGMYASIAEIPKNAETAQYLKTAIIPSLNGNSSNIDSFKKQTGYLNERQVETQGTTITLTNGSSIYAVNIRVFVPDEKDILISVISPNTNMNDAEKIAENIFYSMRLLDDTQTSQNNTSQSTPGAIIVDDLVIQEDNTSDWATDNDTTDTITDNPYIDNYQTEWEIPENNGYIEGETYTYNVQAYDNECEWIYFAYWYSTKKLADIKIQDPDGNIYEYDDIRKWRTGWAYGFHVGKDKSGDYTFIWTAKDSIGEFSTGYTTDDDWSSLIKPR